MMRIRCRDLDDDFAILLLYEGMHAHTKPRFFVDLCTCLPFSQSDIRCGMSTSFWGGGGGVG